MNQSGSNIVNDVVLGADTLDFKNVDFSSVMLYYVLIMANNSREVSLFEDYRGRQPDLGFGFGGGILTEEGARIFAGHIRVDKTQHLSRVF